MSQHDYLLLPLSEKNDLPEVVDTFCSLPPERVFADQTLAVVGNVLYATPFDVKETILAADRVRARMWDIMGGQPTTDPACLAAAAILEGTLINWGDPMIALLARDRLIAHSERVTPGKPHLLAMQYPRETVVLSAGVPSAPDLAVGLVDTSCGLGRTRFAIGVEKDKLSVLLDDVTNCWLGEEGNLEPNSITWSLFCGEAEILPYLEKSFRQTYSKIAFLFLPDILEQEEEEQKLADAIKVAPRLMSRSAQELESTIHAAEELEVSPASIGISEPRWLRYKRIVQRMLYAEVKIDLSQR